MKKIQYREKMQAEHNEFSVTPVVSKLKPMFGASPDSFMECVCCGCGTGVLEVKCPYCVQHKSLEDEAENSSL